MRVAPLVARIVSDARLCERARVRMRMRAYASASVNCVFCPSDKNPNDRLALTSPDSCNDQASLHDVLIVC